MLKKLLFFMFFFTFFPIYVEQIKKISVEGPSAITWKPNSGRFGDNLLSYSKAKWLAYKNNIPLLYLPFNYCDQLMIGEYEKPYSSKLAQQYTNIVHLPASSDYKIKGNNNTLYFSHWHTPIAIDWKNEVFVEELKKTIAPRYPVEKVAIPEGHFSIAIHIRNGGGFAVDTDQEKERCPLRFVSEEFFIEQVDRIVKMLPGEKIYVHIFTDHVKPAKLAKKFRTFINDERVTFGYRTENSHSTNVLEDFFSMMDFDCLIRPGSHFSRFVQRLGNNKLVIYPENGYRRADGTFFINVINIKTRTQNGWKTKKETIVDTYPRLANSALPKKDVVVSVKSRPI